MDAEVTLQYYVKALNDKMVPEGTKPSLLVFVTFPTFPAG